MQNYFFDVTDVARYIEKETTISGIQRVSLEVIRRMVQRHGAERVKITLWDEAAKQYVALDAGFLAEMEEFDSDLLNRVFVGGHVRSVNAVPQMLARYRTHRGKYLFHWTLTHLQAARGNHAYFEKRGTTLAGWQEDKRRAKAAARAARGSHTPQTARSARVPVAEILSPGDQVVIMGATWDMRELGDYLEVLKSEHQAEISLLIHDLIPLLKAEHIAADFSMAFHNWLEQSSRYCTRYFANSQNTAADLKRFLAEKDVCRPVAVVPLAQAMGHVDLPPDDGTMRRGVERIEGLRRDILNMTKLPYALVVGTVESRKNLWRLLQAWARLAQDRDIDAPKLVLAGKMGWHIDDVQNLLRATGNLGGWVEVADRPPDRELAYLYENCEFTATVSHYEGWSLPIGEGLSFGKTGVVADNSSMPEVGGDMVEYCDAGSIDSIYRACRRLIADPSRKAELETRIAGATLRSWDDVAADFLRHLDTI